jgi:hypothetical protein
MIFLETDDIFFFQSLRALLNQKKIFITNNEEKQYYNKVKIKKKGLGYHVSLNGKYFEIQTPIYFDQFFNLFSNLIRDIIVVIGPVSYYPMIQEISRGAKKCKLKEIHNIIFEKVILNKKGVDKISLYKTIWPSDKEIYLNKLDTHLSNLKNELKNQINYELKLNSSNNILKLMID